MSDEETARYEQLAEDLVQQEGEDVVAWLMRSHGMTFVEAVIYANELLKED